jgi:hypothetical protein
MPRLEKRVSAIEALNPHAQDMTLIRQYVRPSQPDTEIYHLRDDDGQQWERLHSETEQQFIDRVSVDAKRTALGIALLTAQLLKIEKANASPA